MAFAYLVALAACCKVAALDASIRRRALPVSARLSSRDVRPFAAPVQSIEDKAVTSLTLEDDGPVQMGFWIPPHLWTKPKYLMPLRELIDEKTKAGTLTPLTPAMLHFKEFVNTHSVYRMWMGSMIEETNHWLNNQPLETIGELVKDGDGQALLIRNFDYLCEYLNEIVTTSPSFTTNVMVGTPMNALLAVSMGTPAGAALFHDVGFNAEFKKVLDSWNAFLKSPASLDKLDISDPEKAGSWISRRAHLPPANVWKDMLYDANEPGYGFDSWNDFFTRDFVPGARPFAGDSDDICIGCETTPLRYEDDLKLTSKFWIKDMDYSLLDIFDGRGDVAKLFDGGQAYQGFLSATHYHQWNCPLDGDLVAAYTVPGTYFAQRPMQGEEPGTWEGTESQPYLGHVASRAIFLFNHAQFGYVAMICIGMVEVSTCWIEPDLRRPLKDVVSQTKSATKVGKAQKLGKFEFGGSTHMVLFQKGKAQLADTFTNIPEDNDNVVHMGTLMATPLKQ